MSPFHILRTYAILVLFLCTFTIFVSAVPGRVEHELSGPGWTLWLDRNADWLYEDALLPPVDLARATVKTPTGGWERLDGEGMKRVSVPGTVEEYYWSAAGNPVGIAGDYRGVSWWSTRFTPDPTMRGKRIALAFESANLRAEVFVNRKLVAYDGIGNTHFEAEVTGALRFGEENRLDVRITDPGGTFSWSDENLLPWGKNRFPSVHGFGGITGRVFLRATDAVRVEDVYVQNQPEARKVTVFATLANSSGASAKGTATLTIHEWKNPGAVLWKKSLRGTVTKEGKTLAFAVDAPKAKLWDIRQPNLYMAEVSFESADFNDTASRRFGFRWFDMAMKDGDMRLYLNGKRVFVLAAMTRGFWPKNGIFPTPEMAKRDMEAAQNLGFNMMLYHRAIGQPLSIEACDEAGMLAYEEPGGYLCNPGPDATAQAWRSEKLRRMILRDRSHPSLVIFNMDDLSSKEPTDIDKRNMIMAHTLDPSRIITYNCIIAPKIPEVPDDPIKLHMRPFDTTFYYHGWTSPYHLMRYGGYLDEYYRNPSNYLRYLIDPVADMGDSLHPISQDEIIFYGEEGDPGAPLRLEKIKEELGRTGADGWREGEHLQWFAAYDRFLDESGFRASFPTVDALTLALGEKMHYFHGRIIENTRISNKADVYVLNGWATEATHTDIADAYRNPTADPAIMQYYTQSLYVAVKIRDKTLPSGGETSADIYLVNEKDLKGPHTLVLSFVSSSGEAIGIPYSVPVMIKGGEDYGQLLREDFRLPPVSRGGYYTLKAELRDGSGAVRATGHDEIFVADYTHGPGIKGRVAVMDTSGAITSFLKEVRGISVEDYDPDGPFYDYIIIGAHGAQQWNKTLTSDYRSFDPVMERVATGSTLIVLDRADAWAARFSAFDYPAATYKGSEHWGKQGHIFVGKHPFLEGLPQVCGMNWEYQALYRGDVWGLRFDRAGVETVAALAANNRGEILDALSRIGFGNGRIIITTLRILPELGSKQPQSAVPKKLFLNLLEQEEDKTGK